MKANVKHWNMERGFGWFRASDGRDYFCHITNWLEPGAPTVGNVVEFDLGPGIDGKRQQAVNARYAHAGADALAKAVSE